METIDYTKIRDKELRIKICKFMSEMLDNPDEHGIFPTSKFMWEMETYILGREVGIITVYNDGTWKLWDGKDYKLDAHYACNDPDWLVNIPHNGPDLLQIIQDFISCWNEDEIYPNSKSFEVLEKAKKITG